MLRSIRALIPALAMLALAAACGPALSDEPPVPLPDDAANVNYESDSGSLMFETATQVKELAAFYRDALRAHGWEEQPSVINNDNMVQLDFSKGDASIGLTLMKMGDHTMVTGMGEGLASGSDSSGEASSGAVENGNTVLTFTDKDGLPTPNESVSSGSESTLFRRSINATVAASVAVVVDMYRKELSSKRWAEVPDKTRVSKDDAFLVFDSPNGPVTLTVKRNGDDTSLQLGLSDKLAASQSPLFPKPGQVKFALGNITDQAVTVKIGKTSVNVPAGVGTSAPDGPMLDVAPGNIVASMPGAQQETIEAGPDQIWMVMIGPGGLLPIRAY